jgi:hypothetical protein
VAAVGITTEAAATVAEERSEVEVATARPQAAEGGGRRRQAAAGRGGPRPVEVAGAINFTVEAKQAFIILSEYHFACFRAVIQTEFLSF